MDEALPNHHHRKRDLVEQGGMSRKGTRELSALAHSILTRSGHCAAATDPSEAARRSGYQHLQGQVPLKYYQCMFWRQSIPNSHKVYVGRCPEMGSVVVCLTEYFTYVRALVYSRAGRRAALVESTEQNREDDQALLREVFEKLNGALKGEHEQGRQGGGREQTIKRSNSVLMNPSMARSTRMSLAAGSLVAERESRNCRAECNGQPVSDPNMAIGARFASTSQGTWKCDAASLTRASSFRRASFNIHEAAIQMAVPEVCVTGGCNFNVSVAVQSLELVSNPSIYNELLALDDVPVPATIDVDIVYPDNLSEAIENSKLFGKRVSVSDFYMQGAYLKNSARVSSVVFKKSASDELLRDDRKDKDPDNRGAKRTFVLRELVSNQSDYLQKIRAILKAFAAPLSTATTSENELLLSKAEHDLLFGEIERIAKIEADLHARLTSALDASNGDPGTGETGPGVCAAISEYCTSLEIYKSFVNSQSQRERIIKRLQGTKECLAICSSARKIAECDRLSLGELMAMPYQRPPRLALLIETLMKHTPRSHVEYPSVVECCRMVKAVVKYIDMSQERTAAIERMQSVVSMTKNCPPTVFSANRWYVNEFRAYFWQAAPDQRNMTQVPKDALKVRIVLFNNGLLVAKERKTLEYHSFHDLDSIQLTRQKDLFLMRTAHDCADTSRPAFLCMAIRGDHSDLFEKQLQEWQSKLSALNKNKLNFVDEAGGITYYYKLHRLTEYPCVRASEKSDIVFFAQNTKDLSFTMTSGMNVLNMACTSNANAHAVGILLVDAKENCVPDRTDFLFMLNSNKQILSDASSQSTVANALEYGYPRRHSQLAEAVGGLGPAGGTFRPADRLSQDILSVHLLNLSFPPYSVEQNEQLSAHLDKIVSQFAEGAFSRLKRRASIGNRMDNVTASFRNVTLKTLEHGKFALKKSQLSLMNLIGLNGKTRLDGGFDEEHRSSDLRAVADRHKSHNLMGGNRIGVESDADGVALIGNSVKQLCNLLDAAENAVRSEHTAQTSDPTRSGGGTLDNIFEQKRGDVSKLDDYYKLLFQDGSSKKALSKVSETDAPVLYRLFLFSLRKMQQSLFTAEQSERLRRIPECINGDQQQAAALDCFRDIFQSEQRVLLSVILNHVRRMDPILGKGNPNFGSVILAEVFRDERIAEAFLHLQLE